MNIIHKGRVPDSNRLIGTCTYCHTVVECTTNEVTQSKWSRILNGPRIRCPLEGCGHTIELTKGQWIRR